MTKKKLAKGKAPATVVANDGEDGRGALARVGGSQSNDWNTTIANQALQTLWLNNSEDEERNSQLKRATLAALSGIGPKDELEGMMAAQLARIFHE